MDLLFGDAGGGGRQQEELVLELLNCAFFPLLANCGQMDPSDARRLEQDSGISQGEVRKKKKTQKTQKLSVPL